MPRLTVGTATFADFDGLYMTIQSLRLFHRPATSDDIEILVVDQTPQTPHGEMARALCANARAKYVAMPEPRGTSPSRNRVFEEATGDFVCCLDSHVMFPPGVIDMLLRKISDDHLGDDLYCGPMLYDHGQHAATHFNRVWSAEMLGVWGSAWTCGCSFEKGLKFSLIERDKNVAAVSLHDGRTPLAFCQACGKILPGAAASPVAWNGHEALYLSQGYRLIGGNPTDLPFEVPAQGLGLFLSRREAWLGFHPEARGFGGEEWCVHEKYRQAGRKTMFLPWLRWLHKFGRPAGVPYSLRRYDRVRNYVLWFKSLGLPLEEIHAHFVHANMMNEAEWAHLVADPEAHADPPGAPPAPACGSCQANSAASIESLFELAAKTPSDLNEHCAILKQLAAGCAHVTDFGMRHAVSTTALLAGQPATLVSYAPVRYPEAEAFARLAGAAKFEFRQADSLSADIEETDLLFLDTKHTGEHLAKELQKHHAKVRRYIVRHDTVIFGERGEDGSPGLLHAVRAFVREHPEWSVVRHDRNNYGLLVLSRDPRDKPALPSLAKQAWNYAKALAKHAASGNPKVTEEEHTARLDVCALCPLLNDGRCSQCGCPVDEKALWATEDCPHPTGSQWPPIEQKKTAPEAQ